MGVVYDVEDLERGQRVALKTLKRRDEESLYRLKKEFRALTDLAHPNLVSLYDLVVEDSTCFYTMELVKGVAMVEYCRAKARDSRGSVSGMCDEPKLRAALPQLVNGLLALHQAGKVHRDIKPSNVLVTESGRVVLLDFGLVADLDLNSADSLDGRIVGTVEYMAPEQAAGEAASRAADWYAVGVLLYEVLTGRVPFSGAIMEILLHKQRYPPAPPRGIVPEVPQDLDALCVDLLSREPSRRPSGTQVLRRIGAQLDPGVARDSMSLSASNDLIKFCGRDEELARLQAALAMGDDKHASVAVIRGPSGIGKSALIRRYLDRLRMKHRRLVVLEGRCYERENVPFKAMDSLIDQLASFWLKLPDVEAAALLPRKASLLQRLFPVLGRVPVIADAPPVSAVLDPQILRTRAYAALREVLWRLANSRELVLVLDDMQWVDPDSIALLSDVMRAPDAPPLRLILSSRDEGWQEPATFATLWMGEEETMGPSGMSGLLSALDLPKEYIELGPLSHEASVALARTLLAGSATDLAEWVAKEARGMPLFLGELTFYLQAVEPDQVAPIRLAQVIRERIERLSDTARALVELVSVAGEPVSQRVAATALDCSPEVLAREVRYLRTAHLVRAPSVRAENRLEPYHDRIRESVRANLDTRDRRRWHRALAMALEQWREGSPERLARHWHAAGQTHRAAELARTAAELAAKTVDFDRAARLYQMTLALGTYSDSEIRALLTSLAAALTSAGRPESGAKAYLQAAKGADPATRLELHNRSASALLAGGYVEQGLAALTEVLAEIGLELAATPGRALRSVMWRRAWQRTRGFRWRTTAVEDIPKSKLMRLDILGSTAISLGVVDHIRGADYQARHLALALSLGEPARVALALGVEASFFAAQGAAKQARRLAAMARELRESLDEPAIPFDEWALGGVDYFCDNRWRDALGRFESVAESVRSTVGASGWAFDTAVIYGLFARLALGEIAELSRVVPALVREAERRGDLYAIVNPRLRANIVWLARDDVAGAERDLEEASALWAPRATTYQVQHFWGLHGRVELELYRGESERAAEALVAADRPLRRSMLLHAIMIRVEYVQLCGRVAAARAAGGASDASTHLSTLKRAARTLARMSPPSARHFSLVLRATHARLSGRVDEAIALSREALAVLESSETMLYASAVKRSLGIQLGGDEGDALIAEADEWMGAQRIQNPAAMSRMLVPGLAG